MDDGPSNQIQCLIKNLDRMLDQLAQLSYNEEVEELAA
jgi:hypothetical protein